MGTAAPEHPAPAPAATTERKTTSVLFGDLVGFTSIAEHRDPEDVRELLTRCFDTARTIVGRYGGTVEKFIGDAVMAVWGAEVVEEDDAERAVRAGLDLATAVGALGEDVGVSGLAMRVGVVTGEVAVTVGAVGQGLVAGDAVNTAARIQALAPAGRTWVDEQTRVRTAASISYRDAGAHVLKGKDTAVPLYEVRAVVAAVAGAQRLDGLSAPLVGRDRDLMLVKSLFHQTAEDQRPRGLLVTGPAGVGKSRLGWEFQSYVDGLSEPVWWHQGRCPAYGDSVAFAALREALRIRFGIEADAPVGTIDARLAAGLERWVTDPARRQWLRPRLAALLSDALTGSSALAREDLFGAWMGFFGDLSRCEGPPAPVVLVLEDVHRADEALLDFVEQALELARYPLFVLALGRTEVTERRPSLGSGRRRTTLYLEALPDHRMAALVDGLVEGLPAATRDALVARAEGIPLYAVETVRALIDRDVVVAVDGCYRATGDALAVLTSGGAPPTLQALVASRLDTLHSAARGLLQDAAVLGLRFTLDGLEALGHPADVAVPLLDELVRRDLVERLDDGPGPGRYGFVQTVVRQVAYDTLSRRDRRTRHLAAAGYLRSLPDPAFELASVIAQHLTDAIAARPEPVADAAITAEVVALLTSGAQRAIDLGAAAEALRLVESALAMVGGGSEDAAALQDLGVVACTMLPDVEGVDRYAEAAIAAHLVAGREARAARTAARRGQFLMRHEGRSRESARYLLPWYRRVHELAAPPSPSADEDLQEALVAVTNALHLVMTGIDDASWGPDFPAGAAVAEQAVALAVAAGDMSALATSLNCLALRFVDSGSTDLGMTLLDYAVRTAQRADRPQDAISPLSNIVGLSNTHDLHRGRAAAEQMAALTEQLASRYERSAVHANLGIAQWLGGEWSRLAETLPQVTWGGRSLWSAIAVVLAHVLAAARGETPNSPPWTSSTSERAGIDDEVRAWAALADHLVDPEHPQHLVALERLLRTAVFDDQPIVWTLAADAALAAGRWSVVEDLLAGVPLGPSASPLLRAEQPRIRGELAAMQRDRWVDAETSLRSAVAALEDFGAVFDAARARLALSDVLAATGQLDAADALRQSALATFTVLGATPWVQRAERPRSTAPARSRAESGSTVAAFGWSAALSPLRDVDARSGPE